MYPMCDNPGVKDTRNVIRERMKDREPAAIPPTPSRRALRLAAGLTQGDVAAAIGVDRATISRWETGNREPVGRNRRAYADACDEMARTAT